MKEFSLSCLMIWILNKIKLYIQHPIFSIQYLASCIFLQTPVFKGEERDLLGEIKQLILDIVNSMAFFFFVIAIIIAIGLYILYNRKKSMPEISLEVIQDDTWFTTRDDNNRVGIVVSVKISNKATRGVYITDCKLSGYSAKESPMEIVLRDTENEKKLDFPTHKNFCKGKQFYLGPYSSESLWFYYESRMITMRNVLETPLTIKDSEKRRKSLRLMIPRHEDQRAIYEEMSRMW